MRKPRVYVSGPMAGAPGSSYTTNIHHGIEAAEALERLGAVPYLPHTNALWGVMFPRKSIDVILERDLSWVEACDAVVRLPGESKGSDMEVEHAKRLAIPVFECRFSLGTHAALVYPIGCGLDKWIREFRQKETVKS